MTNIFGKTRLLAGAAVAVGGLAVAAPQAHALPRFTPVPIHSVYAPAGTSSLGPLGFYCPTLTVTGKNFGANDTVEVELLATSGSNPEYSGGGSFPQYRLVSTNGAGTFTHPVTFTIPRTTSLFYWWAEVSETGHFDSWSNAVECASL
jgi:hypothetical protein